MVKGAESAKRCILVKTKLNEEQLVHFIMKLYLCWEQCILLAQLQHVQNNFVNQEKGQTIYKDHYFFVNSSTNTSKLVLLRMISRLLFVKKCCRGLHNISNKRSFYFSSSYKEQQKEGKIDNFFIGDLQSFYWLNKMHFETDIFGISAKFNRHCMTGVVSPEWAYTNLHYVKHNE